MDLKFIKEVKKRKKKKKKLSKYNLFVKKHKGKSLKEIAKLWKIEKLLFIHLLFVH